MGRWNKTKKTAIIKQYSDKREKNIAESYGKTKSEHKKIKRINLGEGKSGYNHDDKIWKKIDLYEDLIV